MRRRRNPNTIAPILDNLLRLVSLSQGRAASREQEILCRKYSVPVPVLGTVVKRGVSLVVACVDVSTATERDLCYALISILAGDG